MLSFGLGFCEMWPEELLFLCRLQHTVSTPLQPGFHVQNTIFPKKLEPKPQQPLAFTEGTLIICLQHLQHCSVCMEKLSLVNLKQNKNRWVSIYLQKGHLADQRNYWWHGNKCKACFIMCIYPRVLQACQTWRRIFSHINTDIICQESIWYPALFVVALQTSLMIHSSGFHAH